MNNAIGKNEIKDSWIRTYSGNKCFFFKPEKSNIDIVDIAHALSLVCRYNGAVRRFYSVAQHCCIIAQKLLDETGERHIAYQGLMHDSSEAFISDIPRPYKKHFEGYKEAEERFEKWLAEKFYYRYPYSMGVKDHDVICLVTEMRDMLEGEDWMKVGPHPYPETIQPLDWGAARANFLVYYHMLRPEQAPEVDIKDFLVK